MLSQSTTTSSSMMLRYRYRTSRILQNCITINKQISCGRTLLRRQQCQLQQSHGYSSMCVTVTKTKTEVFSSPSLFRRSSGTSRSSSSGGDSTDSSNGEYFSKYEYPLATEPPIITQTKASDVTAKTAYHHSLLRREYAKNRGSNRARNIDNTSEVEDPTSVVGTIDDTLTKNEEKIPSLEEIEDIRRAQKLYLTVKPPGATPITTKVPSYVPPNFPATELHRPTTQLTTLENGVRIVSQNKYGQVSTVGLVCDMGSRTETVGVNKGVSNVLEMLVFNSSTSKYTGQQISQSLQDWGGTRFASCGREQSLLCIDLLRPNVDKAIHMLEEVAIQPAFLDHEIDEAKLSLQYNLDSTPPDLLLGESLQMAAYGTDQQLGQRHFCPVEDGLLQVNSTICRNYWTNQVLNNPNGIVIGGAGIEHEHLLDLVHQYTSFPMLKQDDTNRSFVQKSIYRGGEYRYQLPDPFDEQQRDDDENTTSSSSSLQSMPVSSTREEIQMVKVAVAFEVGGWQQENQQDLVTICVLQTLLGGGSSFSAGGPGKGMYSRLYRQILNRYSWAESAEAFTSFHNESGLFGIMGTTSPNAAFDMTHVLCEHILRLSNELVSDEELSRARNMLKNNVLTQLESRLVLFEDISRQVLTYGHREEMNKTVERIQSVTAEDIQTLIRRSIMKSSSSTSSTSSTFEPSPTIASVGIDLTNVPHYEDIQKWFS